MCFKMRKKKYVCTTQRKILRNHAGELLFYEEYNGAMSIRFLTPTRCLHGEPEPISWLETLFGPATGLSLSA